MCYQLHISLKYVKIEKFNMIVWEAFYNTKVRTICLKIGNQVPRFSILPPLKSILIWVTVLITTLPLYVPT